MLDSGDVKGDQKGRLQFKFYPEGKSNSDQHLDAEDWFHIAPEGGQQDWHFKFTLPKDRKHDPAPVSGTAITPLSFCFFHTSIPLPRPVL